MLSKTRSGPESFVAEVAGDDNSFEMVCFNVIFYVPAIAFLSTRFAPISKTKLWMEVVLLICAKSVERKVEART